MLVRSILKEMMTRTFASAVLVAGSLAATVAVMAAMLSSPPQAPRPIAPAVARQKPDPIKTMRVAVRDPQGQPVSGAKITAGVWTEEKGFKPTRNYETDASGVAQVDLPETFYILRLWASKKPFGTLYTGWEQDELASGRGVPAQYTFSLETVIGASGQIVNEDGRPIAADKVQVGLSHDQSAKPAKGDGRVRYDAGLAERGNEAITDAEGRWRIDNVPDHPGVKFSLLVTHPDYVSDESWEGLQQAGSVTTEMLRKGTATLALKPGVIVEGRVTDPEGKPISEGLIIHGDAPYFASKSCDFPIGADGRFRLPALPSGKMTLTLIAPGYAPQLRRVHLKADSSRQDFQMEPGKPIRLRIIDAAGKPIPRATVAITEWMGKKSLHNHDHPNVRNTKISRNVDENGVWEWLWAPEAPVELEVGSSGFADVPLEIGGGETTRTIVLKSEHRIAGRVTDAVTGRMIPSFTVIPVDVLTTTDAGGRFEFPKVPPVPVSVRVLIGPWEDVDFRSGPSLPILLQPGQRVEVDLGGEGAVLTGRVNLTGKVPSGLDCTYSLNYLVRREPGITVAPIADLGFDARRGWRDLWTKTNESLAYLSTLRHWFVKLAPDGSFSIGGIPAGEYDLAVAIYAKPDGCLVDPLAQSVARVTVTAADAAGRNLTVPDIAAEVLPVPTVGDLPTLAFWGIDDARATIGDYHGQYLLAHFWASWCGPCKQQLPAIRRIHEQYAPRGLATLGFSLDEDPKAWKSALKGLDLPWPQGRLTTAGVTGISSVPAYWLLDREGKIVAKAVDPDELAALLADLLK